MSKRHYSQSTPIGQALSRNLSGNHRTAIRPAEAIQTASQGEEAEWLEWHISTISAPLTNDDLRALAVVRGKKIAPGTIAQHDQYIGEYDRRPFGQFVRAMRQRAIFGIWADGTRKGPELTDVRDVGINTVQWLVGQANPSKYLKWFRLHDPEGYATFLRANSSHVAQSSTAVQTHVADVVTEGRAA